MTTATKPKPAKGKKPKADKPAKAPKAKKEKKPSPETIKIPLYVWEHKLECDKLAAEINADQIRFAEMKDAAMAVKSSMNGKIVSLRQMMAKGPEHLPLLDGPKPTTQDAPAATTATATPAAEVDADAWRNAPLRESLHKPGDAVLTKAIDLLLKAKVDTIGKFEDLRASGNGYRKWQDSVKGIGEEGAEKVTDSALAWLSKNRDAKVLAEARAAGKPDDVAAPEAKPDEVVKATPPKKAAKKKAKAK